MYASKIRHFLFGPIIESLKNEIACLVYECLLCLQKENEKVKHMEPYLKENLNRIASNVCERLSRIETALLNDEKIEIGGKLILRVDEELSIPEMDYVMQAISIDWVAINTNVNIKKGLNVSIVFV